MTTSTLTEPFTPRGVAAFAHASGRRLLLVQSVVAALAAVSLAWFLNENCFSVIHTAIQNLPATGKIVYGKLDWHGDSPLLLAEGRFLALDVDPGHSGTIHSTADVQVEFGQSSLRIYSLLGYLEWSYAPARFAPFNRTDLEPQWGAWADEILFIATASMLVGLLLSWTALATLYFLPAWLLGFFMNRDLGKRASWKLSAAALLPGALVMIAGTALYNFGFLGLVALGCFFAAHFIVGWIYLGLSMFFLPRLSADKPVGNPFNPAKA